VIIEATPLDYDERCRRALHDVALVPAIGDDLAVEATGGTRDGATGEQMIAAAADRVGASASS